MLDAVVVVVAVDIAADRRRQHFTEVVGGAVLARRHHDAADDLVDRRVATGRAGGVLAVELARRLGRLGHGVGARAQAREAVGAVGVGVDGGRHRLAQVIGARQSHRHAGQAHFTGLLDAVVVVVAVHIAGDRCRQDLAEVVVVADQALGQHDAGDGLVAGHAVARGAGGVLAVQLAGRLRGLGHRVGARAQAREGIAAVSIGVDRDVDRLAQVIGALQPHRHAAQAHFARLLDAVVVVVAVDVAADLRTHQLAKVVVDAVVAGRQHHIADDVVDRGIATGAAGGVLAVQVGTRLHFGDGVGASAQASKLIEAVGVGGGAQVDGIAQHIGAGQQHRDAADDGLACTAHAVIAKVFIDIARQAGRNIGQAGVQGVVVLA